MCYVLPAFGDSFLTAQSFPKTFDDLSFKSRVEVISDGFGPFEMEYDDDGVCISGCAYKGITIKEDMAAIDAANAKMAELIAESKKQEAQKQAQKQSQQATTNTNTNFNNGGTTGVAQNNGTPAPVQFPGQSGANNVAQPTFSSGNWCHNGLSEDLPLRYPVDMTNLKHTIYDDFGYRDDAKRFHPAIDIEMPPQTPVYSTMNGKVVFAGWDESGGGNTVIIEGTNGVMTEYMHLHSISVRFNQQVSACQQIGLSGKSGRSTGPHLDYRVKFRSSPNMFVDILCPYMESDKSTNKSENRKTILADYQHSLFHAPYKFYNQSHKRSHWRIAHGHCMINLDDLLPDEVRKLF